ncbi:MAG TPA: hypothetical protein DEA97_04705 [Bacteroidales bacterium]|nr:hypothetical protein [Bacteroidales bacterium]
MNLVKGNKKVTIPINSEIGIITKDKTYIYGQPEHWELDSVNRDFLIIKNVKKYDEITISQNEKKRFEEKREDAILISVSGYGTPDSPKRYTYKIPASYNLVEIPFSYIIEIEYREIVNYDDGCMGVILPPLLIILSPIFGFEEDKYHPENFFIALAIGITGTLAVYLHYRKYRIRKYDLSKWSVELI